MQVEAVFNSRHLYELSPDPKFDVLTPGHLLNGQPLCTVAEHDLTRFPVNRLKRWESIKCSSISGILGQGNSSTHSKRGQLINLYYFF